MGFSRQEYWGGLPCSPLGNLSNPGIEPTSLMSPVLTGGFFGFFFPTSATWELGRCWGTGRPGVLQSMGLQRVDHDWVTEQQQWGNVLLWRLSRKEYTCSAGDAGDADWSPGSGRSPEEGNGNPFQHFCLENPMDGEVWWVMVHGVAKNRVWLKHWTCTHDGMLSHCRGSGGRQLTPPAEGVSLSFLAVNVSEEPAWSVPVSLVLGLFLAPQFFHINEGHTAYLPAASSWQSGNFIRSWPCKPWVLVRSLIWGG